MADTAKWVDYWKVIEPKSQSKRYTPTNTLEVDVSGSGVFSNYSWYQDLMLTAKSRLEKYDIYENMDTDVDVARSLDTIAEEMTGDDEKTKLPFKIEFYNYDENSVKKQDVVTIKAGLQRWSEIHGMKYLKYAIARNSIKKGDTVFRKVSNSRKWVPIAVSNILGIEIDEVGDVKNYHLKGKVIGDTYNQKQEIEIVPADAIVHFSIDDTSIIDNNPFGTSILDSVIRTFKQKNLLEDAIIIYRVVRAPERRVFYIDVGNMPPQKAKKYMEQVRNEINQKRVASPDGHEGDVSVDSIYNPTSMQEDYFFGVTGNGRGSRVETLPGGQGLGENSDLEFFQNRLFRGLRVPSSYMSGQDAAGAQYNDGKVGIAYIEEMRFAKFVMRLQASIEKVFDKEFKLYLKNSGVNLGAIEEFSIKLPVPQNFALYRQSALNTELINTLQAADGIDYLSKRFILKRFMDFSDDDITTNQMMLAQERSIDIEDGDTVEIEEIQQIYDPAFYENREKITLPESDDEEDSGEVDPEDEDLSNDELDAAIDDVADEIDDEPEAPEDET